MVRSLAANAMRLREISRRTREQGHSSRPFCFIPQDDILLDRVAPALMVVFLAIAGYSMFVQFTTSRESSLHASEESLTVAAHLVAREIATAIERGQEIRGAIQHLPREATSHGRRFLVLDEQDIVRDGLGLRADRDKFAARLFQPMLDYPALRNRPGIQRVMLEGGTEVSLITLALPAPKALLITLQPVEDELTAWREHAFTVLALILCFSAVTIALGAAYAAQRTRARHAGATANDLQSRFESALDRGRCGLWEHTMASREVAWSASMWRLLGLGSEPEQIDIATLEAHIHPDDMSPFVLAEAALRAREGEIDHLFRMRHVDGCYVWLRMRAVLIAREGDAPARLLGFVMDVTEERVSEEEIHRADLRLRDAIESISEAFVLWDENNQLVMCNTKYQNLHGLSTELVQRGTRYQSLMAGAQAPRIEIEIPQNHDQVSGSRSYEAQLQDGRWLQVSERHTQHGGFVSVGTDITARKEQEERLVENERQLRMTITDLAASRETLRKQADQLAELADRYLEQKAEAISASRTKAEFLANMNHEMRTPLNAIIGFAEAMQEQVWGPIGSERYVGYVADIQNSGTCLLALIDDILDMANIEAGRVSLTRQTHPLGQILVEAATRAAPDAGAKNITLSVEPDQLSPTGQRGLLIDPDAITQALTHLLRNAIRLSPQNGQVSMRARFQGDHVNIFIADAGSMLTASEIGALRDPFGHIDGMLQNGCKGSGLGFPIAKALIELHGGTLKMRSSPQIGSLVMAHLPIAPEPEQLSLPMPLRPAA